MDEYWDFQCCKYGLYECPCEQSAMCVEHCDATVVCRGTTYHYGLDDDLDDDEIEALYQETSMYYDSI